MIFWPSGRGMWAKAVRVEGLEQGLGTATEPALPLDRLMALCAMKSFARRSGTLQRWLWEGPESQPAGLEHQGDLPDSQASVPFKAPETPTTSPK